MQPYPPYGAPPQAMPPAYGMPPPGYAPPPVYYPPPQPTFETREGVKFFNYSLLLSLIASLVSFILALAAIIVIASNLSNWTVSATATLTGIWAVFWISGVLSFIAFILMIIGFIKFYQGKYEFGPQHEQNVRRGILYYLLAFIIPFIGAGIAAVTLVWMILSGDLVNAIRMFVVVIGIIAVVAAYLQAMSYTILVKIFTSEEASKFKSGMILMIISPIIGLSVVVVLIPSGINSTLSNGFSNAMSIGNIVSVIAIWFFYQGYKSILAKMDTGAIRPGLMPAPMYPPGYAQPPMPPQPYQPPPPSQPYQPPPSQMEPQPYSPPPPAQYPQQPAPPQYPQPPQYPPPY